MSHISIWINEQIAELEDTIENSRIVADCLSDHLDRTIDGKESNLYAAQIAAEHLGSIKRQSKDLDMFMSVRSLITTT